MKGIIPNTTLVTAAAVLIFVLGSEAAAIGARDGKKHDAFFAHRESD